MNRWNQALLINTVGFEVCILGDLGMAFGHTTVDKVDRADIGYGHQGKYRQSLNEIQCYSYFYCFR